jgi:hypothetical protein
MMTTALENEREVLFGIPMENNLDENPRKLQNLVCKILVRGGKSGRHKPTGFFILIVER